MLFVSCVVVLILTTASAFGGSTDAPNKSVELQQGSASTKHQYAASADFLRGGDKGTILQVVRNPGWLLPYVSCIFVAVGMLVHFGIHLIGFLSRRSLA